MSCPYKTLADHDCATDGVGNLAGATMEQCCAALKAHPSATTATNPTKGCWLKSCAYNSPSIISSPGNTVIYGIPEPSTLKTKSLCQPEGMQNTPGKWNYSCVSCGSSSCTSEIIKNTDPAGTLVKDEGGGHTAEQCCALLRANPDATAAAFLISNSIYGGCWLKKDGPGGGVEAPGVFMLLK